MGAADLGSPDPDDLMAPAELRLTRQEHHTGDQHGSAGGGLRVVLISPAQRMNYAAANALLKVLEEPPEGLLFVLVRSPRLN